MPTWFLYAVFAVIFILASTALFFFTLTRGALILRGVQAGSKDDAAHVYPIYSNMRLIRLVDFQPILCQRIHPGTVSDVVVDRHRKGIGFLEDHADPAAEMNDIHCTRIYILAVELDSAFEPRSGDKLVHAVQRPQEC